MQKQKQMVKQTNITEQQQYEAYRQSNPLNILKVWFCCYDGTKVPNFVS